VIQFFQGQAVGRGSEDADDGDAAAAAMAKASMRTNFMTSPGGAIVRAVPPSYEASENPAQYFRDVTRT